MNQNKRRLIDTNILFQFSVDLRAATVVGKRRGEYCELDESYELPKFFLLGVPSSPVDVSARLAWAPDALLMRFVLTEYEPNLLRQNATGKIRFWIDSRGAVGNKRLTKFCTEFIFDYNLPQTKVESAFRTVSPHDDSRDSTWAAHTELFATVQHAGNPFDFNAHIPAACLHGYQPDEFPQISVFFALEIGQYFNSTASVSGQVPYHKDPSHWVRCLLK